MQLLKSPSQDKAVAVVGFKSWQSQTSDRPMRGPQVRTKDKDTGSLRMLQDVASQARRPGRVANASDCIRERRAAAVQAAVGDP
jgi:hypothetical protein